MGESFLEKLRASEYPTQPALTALPTPGRDTTRYALAALKGEVANIQAVPIGQGRNHQLNISSMKMGQLVAIGAIEADLVTETLGAADGGLDFKATRATIASGLAAGIQQGRSIPEPTRIDSSKEVPPWESSDDPLSEHYSPSQTKPTSSDIASTMSPATSTSISTLSTTSLPSETTTSDDSKADYVRTRLPIINWRELFDDETTEEWIVEPLLPARRLIALYSAPKVGKSLIVLELAVAIAQGSEVLGTRLGRRRRVLYVDFENDPRGDIRQRLQNMAIEPEQLADLCYLSFPTLGGLDSERGALELMAAVEVYDCEVVVIDTVSRSVDGDENENDTWLNFYRHTGLKMKQAGIAMIRLDHTGKDETKGQRGGSAKEGDVDAIWKMQRLTDGADGPESFRLTCTHSRFQIPAAEKMLTLIRHENPLRHSVKATGGKDIIVDAIVAHLDRIEAPLDDGYRKFDLAEIRTTIGGASQRTLTDAILKRREMHGLAAK